MQPVTINNNKFSNTLWLVQFGLSLLTVMIVWVSMAINWWLISFLPLIVFALYLNHLTIQRQANLAFKMHSNGQMKLNVDASDQSKITGKPIFQDDISVKIASFWAVPKLLFLKLHVPNSNKPVYLMLFRAVLGPSDFSQLLVGLTQMKSSHEYSK